jgi:hypothetical protein
MAVDFPFVETVDSLFGLKNIYFNKLIEKNFRTSYILVIIGRIVSSAILHHLWQVCAGNGRIEF